MIKKSTNPLIATVRQIETKLANFYDFDLSVSATDHLVDFDTLQTCAPELLKRDSMYRASVVSIVEEEDVFVGLFISDEIRTNIESNATLQRLDNTNLDSFCVLVEEVSHFHLLMNRICSSIPISQLELEWQGEVDKFLIASNLLLHQTDNPHFQQLFELLFERFELLPNEDMQRYLDANHFAAKFWNRMLANFGSPFSNNAAELKAVLRSVYRAGLQEKLSMSESFKRVA